MSEEILEPLNKVHPDYRWELLRTDTVTVAGRTYPVEALETVRRSLEAQINHMVQLGAPAFDVWGTGMSANRMCATIYDPQISDGVLTVKVRPLDTPMGRQLKFLLDADYPIRLYASGTGNVDHELRVTDYRFDGGFFESVANVSHNNIGDDLK